MALCDVPAREKRQPHGSVLPQSYKGVTSWWLPIASQLSSAVVRIVRFIFEQTGILRALEMQT